MNNFKQNEQMELLARAAEKQPDALTPSQKMSVGLYQDAKQRAERTELTPDEKLRLVGLKERIPKDNLTPSERTIMALEILEMEAK